MYYCFDVSTAESNVSVILTVLRSLQGIKAKKKEQRRKEKETTTAATIWQSQYDKVYRVSLNVLSSDDMQKLC